MNRVFLLSPANCNGVRAQWALKKSARSDLALRLRGEEGVPFGEVFSFFSALYFRGKLAYARTFAGPPAHGHGVLIITLTTGRRANDTAVQLARLGGFARV